MADTETSSTVTVLAHPAPFNEAIQKKVDEQTQDTKPTDILPSTDDEAKSNIKKPKLENLAGPDVAAEKVEESPPAVIEDNAPDKNVPADATLNGVKTPVTEPEASVAQETNVEPQGTHVDEKTIDTVESTIKEEPETDSIENESGDKTVEKPLRTELFEKKDEEAEAVEKKLEDKSEVEKVPEEKPTVVEIKDIIEEKPVGQLESAKEEKEADEAIASVTLTKDIPELELGEKALEVKTVDKEVGNASEEKSATEVCAEIIVEDTTKIDSEEKPMVEVTSIQEEASLQEATDRVTHDKQEIEVSNTDPEDKEAEETLIGEKTTVKEAKEAAAIETVETEQENQAQVVEKVVATLELPAPTEDAQADHKAAKDTSVSEPEKAVSGADNEEPVKEEMVTEKVEDKKAKDDIIEEVKEKKSFKLGELMQEETNEPDDTNNASNADHIDNSSKVAEETDKEQPSKDIEAAKKEDTPTSVETNKGKDVSNADATINKPTEAEHKNGQLDVKSEDEVESNGNEATKESDKLKSDENNHNSAQESSKDVDNGKESQDLAMHGKTAPKQSSNIMSKVKQSIVKVKKAIVKKSPSSKTLSPEAKSDGKAK